MFRRLSAFLGLTREPRVLLSERTFEPADHPLRAAFDERYLAMRAAMASGERGPIAELLAPDFTSVDAMGRTSGAKAMINSVLGLKIDRSKRFAKTTIVEVEVADDVARLLQHYRMVSAPDAPPSMPRMVQALSRDRWRLVDGTWLLERTETLETEAIAGSGRHVYRTRSLKKR